MSLAVHLSGITKRFGSVVALDSVDLQVTAGTIHAVVGENGAGKTTLMRVLYGALRADEGVVEVNGQPCTFRGSGDAISAGVGMVSQHYGIIPDLSCLQNLILGAEGGFAVNLKAAEAKAQELATQMGFTFDWSAEASTLTPAGAQKLEILKLLWRGSRIMILDEPTAMLSPADSEALFVSLRLLAQKGATVLLVTHRLPEVMDHCQAVTVLRGGKKVADRPVAETNARELAGLIIGGSLRELEPPASHAPGEAVLEARGLVVRGSRGDDALKGIDLTVRTGEILGIAGVDGSGQRELFQAILGLARPASGSLSILGSEHSALKPGQRLAKGLRLIPEDRHSEGVIEEWALEENVALGLQRLAPLAMGPKIGVSARRELAQTVAERFSTKHGGLNMPMASLSGGNQQRFVAARALALGPKLILAFQPARGLDLNGTRQVYEGIRVECERGAAAIVVSFDLDELLEHADRIVAMNLGRVYEPGKGEEKDRAAIGRLMVGTS